VVTGASTGALMASYAFLGPEYDNRLYLQYTSITAADVFELGGTRESMLDTWPLAALIAKHVTPELLGRIAREHEKGGRLLGGTTKGEGAGPVVWNMGVIAAQGGEVGLQLFRKILLASASIPGLFPAVMIDVQADGHKFQEMHVDGGAAAPFY